MRLFIISDEQLLDFYDCVLDGNLKKFDRVLAKIKEEQEIRVAALLTPPNSPPTSL
jgi:hypothetical protein